MNAATQYKCLSIRQPFAWEVCIGEKTVENKPKKTSHRGLLLIHAGKKTDGLDDLKASPDWNSYKCFFTLGAIIGAAELVECTEFNRSLETNPRASGPYCYLLKNPRLFEEPIPCTGQLGLFGLPDELTARVEEQLKRPGRAVQVPEDLLRQVRPSPARACYHQGHRYLESGHLDDALRRLDDAIRLDNANADAYLLRSITNNEMEKIEAAVGDVSEAIRLNDSNATYFLYRGQYQRLLNRLPEAVQDFTKVIELEPEVDEGYLYRGIAYTLESDYPSALAEFRRASELNPDEITAPLLTGAVLIQSGKVADGIEALKKTEKKFPDDPYPSYFLYCWYYQAGESKQASAALDRFRKKSGDEQDVKGYMEDVGVEIGQDAGSKPEKPLTGRKKSLPDSKSRASPGAKMDTITLFTWGYYGWGNHTPQLVQAVDAVETSRGFQPPVFVDIRIRREVRATGFKGNAFEKLLGESRHRWMKSLGNKFIETRSGPTLQIAEPKAASELLDLAAKSAEEERRVLFFCGCQWPKVEGKLACHRTAVASLLFKAAKKRGTPVEIVEWPGGDPSHLDVEVSPESFQAVAKGRFSIPLGKEVDLAIVAGLPWGSIATVHSDGQTLHRVVGPAVWQKDQWQLPVLFYFFDADIQRDEYEKEGMKLRRSLGLESQITK